MAAKDCKSGPFSVRLSSDKKLATVMVGHIFCQNAPTKMETRRERLKLALYLRLKRANASKYA